VNGISFCFCSTIAPFIPRELVAVEAQTSALAFGTLASLTAIIAATATFYPLQTAFGGYSFLIFAGASGLSTLCLWRWLPETKV